MEVTFEIIQGDEKFTVGDYVEIIPKDLEKDEIRTGYINNSSDSKLLVLNDGVMSKNVILYSKIAEIKSII